MIAYLVNQIVIGNLTYQDVITKKPTYKAQIDTYIEEKDLTIDMTV